LLRFLIMLVCFPAFSFHHFPIILVVNLQEEQSGESIRRNTINSIFKDASMNDPKGYLVFSEEQNVSGDIIGFPKAAAIIEGHETHTRTADVAIDLQKVGGIRKDHFDPDEFRKRMNCLLAYRSKEKRMF